MQETRFEPWVGKIPLEKGMASHSGTLAWEIPWTVEPGGLQSTGSERIRHDRAHTHIKSQLSIRQFSLKASSIILTTLWDMLSFPFYRWGDTKPVKDKSGQAWHKAFDFSELVPHCCPWSLWTLTVVLITQWSFLSYLGKKSPILSKVFYMLGIALEYSIAISDK